ncbi:hypothetical protein PYCCODRAFT_240508 [Trametes coccinea BRFM310]|uniref:DUF6697 domain-containing protein n=1 Tax=Trametes coccinea (strain BRFM310) TaxID=1353009 RepID=A0A1Y2ISG6_TRAC3|nr:hypothetical protein PYCCODRAFT_240508 [Trametes coccinea BRFM310]
MGLLCPRIVSGSWLLCPRLLWTWVQVRAFRRSSRVSRSALSLEALSKGSSFESASPLARSHNISCYLCPNMDHNAWSPSGPGKHGYMQVGLGRDRDLFNDGEYRHVFVGAGKHFVYCGWYHVLRVERLTKEEWGTLPPKVRKRVFSDSLFDDANALLPQVQSTYAATTMNKEKSKEFKSSQHVLAMYNAGELRAPCVRLQCIGFDTAFYQELVRANDQYFEHKPRPLPPAGGAGGAATRKRRRVSKAEEKAEDSEVEVSLASGMATTRLPASSMTIEPSPALPPPSASAAGPSAQGPSLSPVRSTRSSTARASGSLTLRIPGGRAMDRGFQPDWPDDSEGNLLSASDEDDWYADP